MRTNRLLNWGSCLTFCLSSYCQAAAEPTKTNHGILLHVGSTQIELAATNDKTFRLSVCDNGTPVVTHSVFLADPVGSADVKFDVVQHDGLVGVHSAAGSLLADPEHHQYELLDADGKVRIPLSPLPDSPSSQPNMVAVQIAEDGGATPRIYGCGNGTGSLLHTGERSRVENGIAVVPSFWSTAGYAVLVVGGDDNAPSSWKRDDQKHAIEWDTPGHSVDSYLSPAKSLYGAMNSLTQLTGRPAVPPRWTFGYLQSRWGWKDKAYIDDTLKQFADRHLPIDAFIFDFEWYTKYPDYGVPKEGRTDFVDFSFNPTLFPDPANQIKAMHDAGVHFVGIRKPRMGNTDVLKMVRDKGWARIAKTGDKFDLRDLNFQIPALRTWYAQQSEDLLNAGVDGWWDDEGESTFSNYLYWTMAQQQELAAIHPEGRLWTLNRAFAPGLQRFGGAAWTGDIHANWPTLARVPTDLLNWSLCGMPYVTCDGGGFSGKDTPELLTRWMQAATFFPIMRTHSDLKVPPRFPWLYGPTAEDAIRQTLDLRYQLVPLLYSLAHESYEDGAPIVRPLVMEYPNDPAVADLSSEWLVGRGLLAAPILSEDGKRSIYLPNDIWYDFFTNKQIATSATTLNVEPDINQIPLFVHAGTILPLAPKLEHTRDLPGGPLDLRIYAGKDGDFVLVEDDGETTQYSKGNFRRTSFHWSDAEKKLSWTVDGPYAGKDVFTDMKVTVVNPDGQMNSTDQIGKSGELVLNKSN